MFPLQRGWITKYTKLFHVVKVHVMEYIINALKNVFWRRACCKIRKENYNYTRFCNLKVKLNIKIICNL